jgi:hypothetical protein
VLLEVVATEGWLWPGDGRPEHWKDFAVDTFTLLFFDCHRALQAAGTPASDLNGAAEVRRPRFDSQPLVL